MSLGLISALLRNPNPKHGTYALHRGSIQATIFRSSLPSFSTLPLNTNNSNNEAYRETVITALLASRQVVQVFAAISENSEEDDISRKFWVWIKERRVIMLPFAGNSFKTVPGGHISTRIFRLGCSPSDPVGGRHAVQHQYVEVGDRHRLYAHFLRIRRELLEMCW
jgi:hypothetical protein